MTENYLFNISDEGIVCGNHNCIVTANEIRNVAQSCGSGCGGIIDSDQTDQVDGLIGPATITGNVIEADSTFGSDGNGQTGQANTSGTIGYGVWMHVANTATGTCKFQGINVSGNSASLLGSGTITDGFRASNTSTAPITCTVSTGVGVGPNSWDVGITHPVDVDPTNFSGSWTGLDTGVVISGSQYYVGLTVNNPASSTVDIADFELNGSNVVSFAPTGTTLTPTPKTSGVLPYLTWKIPADTGLTAATEAPGFQTVTATRTWATTGTVATQRENLFTAPTYASASASQTFTKAATLAISGAPIAGSNAIITNPYALWVQGGMAQLDGGVTGTTGSFSSTLGAAGHVTFEGVTSTGATGSGALVFGTSPTFSTSAISPLWTAAGNVLFQPGADTTGAFQFQTHTSPTTFLTIDSSNKRLRIGDSSVPTATLDVAGLFKVGGSTGIITTYDGVATVRGGVPSIVATDNKTGQNGILATSQTLYTVPNVAAAQGIYCADWTAVVTTAATTSTLGGTVGFQLVYTDVDTGASVTTPAAGAPSAGSNTAYSQTNQQNTVGTQASGHVCVNAKQNTAITYGFGYTSAPTFTMVYALHVSLEAKY